MKALEELEDVKFYANMNHPQKITATMIIQHSIKLPLHQIQKV